VPKNNEHNSSTFLHTYDIFRNTPRYLKQTNTITHGTKSSNTISKFIIKHHLKISGTSRRKSSLSAALAQAPMAKAALKDWEALLGACDPLTRQEHRGLYSI